MTKNHDLETKTVLTTWVPASLVDEINSVVDRLSPFKELRATRSYVARWAIEQGLHAIDRWIAAETERRASGAPMAEAEVSKTRTW